MYISETQKIRPLVEKYCSGLVIDVGCGNNKIVPHAIGIDCRKLPTVNIVTDRLDDLSAVLPEMYQKVDCLYSSHCLEHFKDDKAALTSWGSLVKALGYMVLYLPDDRHYNNDSNPEHLHRYKYPEFLEWFKKCLPEFSVIDSGEHFGDDLYSFYVVAHKISEDFI